MTAIAIRPEQPADEAAIHALIKAASNDAQLDGADQSRRMDSLRQGGDLALSLVAEDAERIVGHIACARIVISDGTRNWYALGPVSVRPDMQRQGIGFRLVQRGIADMRAGGARGLVVLGDPAFYGRFGFETDAGLAFPTAPTDHILRLVFDGPSPAGIVTDIRDFR